jgi:hypothetical protein
MDDNQTQNVASTPLTDSPDSAPAAVEPDSGQTEGSDTSNTPPTAPESPINDDSSAPVEDQNPLINQSESNASEEPIPTNDEPPISESTQPIPVQSAPASAPTAQTPTVPQAQPSAQQNQTSFIRALLAKANAKLGSNRQKKLDKIILTAQKKGFITNAEAQDLLHCSDATATRYLSKLVKQGRLNRTDGSHWVKYLFVR